MILLLIVRIFQRSTIQAKPPSRKSHVRSCTRLLSKTEIMQHYNLYICTPIPDILTYIQRKYHENCITVKYKIDINT